MNDHDLSRPMLPWRLTWLALSFWLTGIGVAAVGIWLGAKGAGSGLAYPLDDAYIHLSMARTLVESGVWGMSPAQFVSANSSPLYMMLAAALHPLAGVYSLWVLTAASGLLLSGLLGNLLSGGITKPIPQMLAGVFLALAMPLPAMMAIGMEHILHTALTLAAIRWWLEGGAERRPWLGGLWVALAVATRLEGLFLGGILAAALVYDRRPRAAIAVVIGMALPMSLLGAFSVSQGGMALPNSVLIKGGQPGVLGLLINKSLFAQNTLVGTILVAAAVMGWRVARHRFGWEDRPNRLLTVLILLALAHRGLSQLGWYYRYEAYLIVLLWAGSLWALSAMAQDVPRVGSLMGTIKGSRFSWPIVLVALGLGVHALSEVVIIRMANAARVMPGAVRSIYRQQVYMGRFLARFYPGEPFVANDIGAPTYFGRGLPIDVVGLGTTGIARHILAHKKRGDGVGASLHTQVIPDSVLQAHSSGARVALLYDFYEPEGFSWVRAGRWLIADNTFAADDEVFFFAPDSSQALILSRQMMEFGPSLPAGILTEVYLPTPDSTIGTIR